MLDSSSSLRFDRRRVPSCEMSEILRALTGSNSVRVSWSACVPSCPVRTVSTVHNPANPRTFEFLNNSITRRSYAENPATSRTTERTNLVFWDETPLRWLGFATLAIGVVGCPLLRPLRRSAKVSNWVQRPFVQTHWIGPWLFLTSWRVDWRLGRNRYDHVLWGLDVLYSSFPR